MSFNDNHWTGFTFDEPQAVGFLDLPFSIKEKICRFLQSKKDKHQLSLTHRKWSTAAQTILFEDIRFNKPEQLRTFIYTVKKYNRIALLVKEIQLTYVDHEEDAIFKTIVKSDQARHGQDTPLKDLQILTSIVQNCEKIEAVTIYGWSIEPHHIESLASFTKNLSSLYIIGANPKSKAKGHPLPLNSILPNLTTLRLDGDFGLTEAWVSTLAHKGHNLHSLQISLKNMHRNVLVAVCSANLKLKELTLTDCASLRDEHVYDVVSSFPFLQKLCLEGATQLTSITIALALKYCSRLVDLEIRLSSSSTQNSIPEATKANMNEIYKIMEKGNIAQPTRLVLENMWITDDEIMLFSPYLTHLNTLGIKDCKLLSNKSLVHIFDTQPEAKKFLHHLYLSNCPHITSILFAELSQIENVSRSIMDIHIESCGDILPRDIYKLCCASITYNLRRLTLTDYQSLQRTVIGSFNENTDTRAERSRIILNKQSLDALVHSNDSELCPIPKDRLLTGNQIILLAKHLHMTTTTLEDLFSKIEEEDIQQQQHKTKHVSLSTTADLSKRKDRVGMLRASSISSTQPRPNTPAIWNQELQNGFLPIDDGNTQSTLSVIDSRNEEEEQFDYTENSEEQTSYDNDDSYDSFNDNDDNSYENDQNIYHPTEHEYDQDEQGYNNNDREEHEDDDYDQYSNEDEQIEEEPVIEEEVDDKQDDKWIKETGEIDLGGWGVSTNDWSSPSKVTKTPTKPHQPSFVEIQQQQQQQQQQKQYQQQQEAWVGYREQDYQNNWVADPLEVNTRKSKKPVNTHSRNGPVVAEADGWGVPKKYVAWENTNEQGFVAEVLDRQKSTQYWQRDADGWRTLNSSEPKAPVTTERISTKTTTTTLSYNDFPILQTANATDKPTISFRTLAEKAKDEENGRSRFSRPRNSSVVSSDSDVNWDSGDNVQFKLHNNDNLDREAPNGIKKPTNKWATAPEWKAKSGNKKDSWGNELASTSSKPTKPEVADDDQGATKSWSTFVNNNASPRRSYSRPRSSTPRPFSFGISKDNTPRDSPTFETGQWNEFSAANSNVSPVSPPRSSTNSPFKKAEQRSSTPSVDNLIDTDNVLVNTNILSANPVKNEVWDTMNELNSSISPPPKVSAMNDILLPRDISKPNDSFKPDEPASTLPPKVPTITESFEWSNDDVPSHISSVGISSGSSPRFHFEKNIPGTITEQEKQRKKEVESKDNLVSLDDSPIMSTPKNLLHSDNESDNALVDFVSRKKEPEQSSRDTSKDEDENDVFGLGSSSQQQTSDDEQKVKFSFSLQVQTTDGESKLLSFDQDSNVPQVVRKFCDDNKMPDYYENVLQTAQNKFQKKKTKYVLKKTKKPKNNKNL